MIREIKKSKYQIMCFSPTGNTLYLANHLKEKLKCDVIDVRENIYTDHLIIMSSVHAFKVPLFLKEKIKNINKLSIIAVGCNVSSINKAAATHLLKKAKKENIELMTYKILAMPLTIVKKFDLNYGKKIIDESLRDINIIANNIHNNKKDILKVPLSARMLTPVHYIESFFVKLFGLELYANKNCIKCGTCVKDCPKKNIKMKQKPKFGLNCMLCMRCIYRCPTKAIHPRISKFIEIDNYNLEEYTK